MLILIEKMKDIIKIYTISKTKSDFNDSNGKSKNRLFNYYEHKIFNEIKKI